MLKNLLIRNYAIIDEISIDFSERMNVITGETGAGKSILMGALSLILGDRADLSVLRDRSAKCVVEGLFDISGRKSLAALLETNGLADEAPDGPVVIRREILSSGKSRAFINDTPVNLEQLRSVSSLLVDLHRQFDTLSMSEKDFQLNVMDALAGTERLRNDYRAIFKLYRTAEEMLRELQDQKNSFAREYDYHRFLFDELEEAGFSENELEDAEQELRLLSSAEAVKAALGRVEETLLSGEHPLLQQLRFVQQQLDQFAKLHPSVEDLSARVRSVQLELDDIGSEVNRLNQSTHLDAARIETLNERLSLGYRLQKKHGLQSTAQLLALRDELSARLDTTLQLDEKIEEAQQQVREQKQQVEVLALKLSEKRKQQLAPFQKNVNKLLTQVGMPNALLKVDMKPVQADERGMDAIEFLFDANKSNRFEPVGKVASGGELSRLMLSVKSLVAQSMDMPTLIFDEIDTGISGEAARQVGIIMQSLAENRQLITITHQPQIAGRAHAHYFVYKESAGDTVSTSIRQLKQEERVTAIARMLGGEKPSAAAMENAREMVMH